MQLIFDASRLYIAMPRSVLFCMITSLFFISSCREEYPFYDGPGKKPVYISYDELEHIVNQPPRPVQNTGTIYWLDTLFFLLEQKKGIHIFNVRDSSNPVPLTFIQIPAINDFTIAGHVLYADNGANLVAIDISDIYNVKVLNIQRQVFQPIMFPPLYSGYFECVDTSKGVVIEWADAYLQNAACQIFN
jgi:hypothetical protein